MNFWKRATSIKTVATPTKATSANKSSATGSTPKSDSLWAFDRQNAAISPAHRNSSASTLLSTPGLSSPYDDSDTSDESDWDTTTTSPSSLPTCPNWEDGDTLSLSQGADYTTLDTETFPYMCHLWPSETNGTYLANTFAHPINTATEAINAAKTFHVSVLQAKLQDIADAAGETVNQCLNETFEDRDAVEMGNKVVDMLNFTMPTYNLPQLVDRVTDGMIEMAQNFKSSSPEIPMDEGSLEVTGNKWSFADTMASRARNLLIDQQICRKDQITSSVSWYDKLNWALVRFFEQQHSEHFIKNLFEMTPQWCADDEKKVWRLLIDTNVMDLSTWDGEHDLENGTIVLDSGFALPETACCAKIADLDRGIRECEDEWIEIE